MDALILHVLAAIVAAFGVAIGAVAGALWLLWRAGGRQMREGRRG